MEDLKRARALRNKDQIVSFLKGFATQPQPSIDIYHQPENDIEAKEFADQIRKAFHNAGWHVVYGNGPGTEDDFQGVRFVKFASSRDPSLEKLHSQRRDAVVKAMELFEESCQISSNPSTDDLKVGQLTVSKRSYDYPTKQGCVRMSSD